MSFSQTIAIGRLVEDPQMRSYGNEGKELANFRLACNIGRDETAFYSCTAFGKTAEIIKKYTNKGKQIQVVGTFKNNNYEKEVNGQKITMYDYNLTVHSVTLLGNSPTGGQAPSQGNATQSYGGNATQSYGQTQTQQTGIPEGFNAFNLSEDNLPF